MWQQNEGDVVFRTLPHYKTIVKEFLQKQIQYLLEQMSEEAGEESVIMTVNLESGRMSHLGSRTGKPFLDDKDDLKSEFLSFCLSNYNPSTSGNQNTHGGSAGLQPSGKGRKRKLAKKMTAVNPKQMQSSSEVESFQEPDQKFNLEAGQGEASYNANNERDEYFEFLKLMENTMNNTSHEDCFKNSALPLKETSDKNVNQTVYNNEPFSQHLQHQVKHGDESFEIAEHQDTTQNRGPQQSSMNRFTALNPSTGEANIQDTPLNQYPDGGNPNELDGSQSEPASEVGAMEPPAAISNKYLSIGGVVTLSRKGHVLRHKKPEPTKPRLMLTFSEKFQILQDIEANPNMSHRQLAKKNNVGRSTIGLISKNRSYYKSQYEIYAESPRKKFKATKYNTINDSVWSWYSDARASGLLVSGIMVREKALEIAKELSETDFKASNGWLASWQSRYNVKSFRVSEESKLKAINVSEWTTNYPRFDTEAVGDDEVAAGNKTEDQPAPVDNTGNGCIP